jgi:hypothetical protein
MAPVPSDGLAAVARTALTEPDALTATVLDAVVAALPELTADPTLAAMLRTTVIDTVAIGLSVIGSGAALDEVHAPPAALRMARRLAQQNVPLPVMLRAYRLGQAAFQQALVTRVADGQRTAAEVAAAARELLSTTFGFVDLVAEQAVLAYQQERDGWIQRRNAARFARVTALLAGSDTSSDPSSDVEHALGYPMSTVHLGAVLWTEGDSAGLDRQATTLAEALGCPRPPLVVPADGASAWVWFPAPRHDPAGSTLVAGTFAAFGEPAVGIAGFRSSHAQARRVQLVAALARSADRPAVTTPALLGPLQLLALDPAVLGDWVRSVLGDLARADADAGRLRDTLWAHLASGGNASGAAQALHLHRNTVQYRLAKAERLRGRPVADDRLAVEVALLACRVLGSVLLDGEVTTATEPPRDPGRAPLAHRRRAARRR